MTTALNLEEVTHIESRNCKEICQGWGQLRRIRFVVQIVACLNIQPPDTQLTISRNIMVFANARDSPQVVRRLRDDLAAATEVGERACDSRTEIVDSDDDPRLLRERLVPRRFQPPL